MRLHRTLQNRGTPAPRSVGSALLAGYIEDETD
jgi:hypothetical protein